MKILFLIIAVAIVVGGIAIYGISPYFTESSVNEEIPDNVAIPQSIIDDITMEDEAADITTQILEDMKERIEGGDEMMVDEDEEMMDKEEMMIDDEAADITTQILEDMKERIEGGDEMMVDEDEEMMDKEEMMIDDEEKTTIYSGTFIGVNDGIHNAEGMSVVLPLEDGSQILRLEDFRATNGPDLYVYLSVDKQASDFVSLGKLKANMGNQNYEIPAGTDLTKYDKVLVWCKPFSVLFGSAQLEPYM
jgi:ElaB/YqjD/DUF883 family membrane-anchored ribosome-binding protein